MEAGNLLWSTRGVCASARLLEPILEGEETVGSVFAVDAGDQKLLRIGK